VRVLSKTEEPKIAAVIVATRGLRSQQVCTERSRRGMELLRQTPFRNSTPEPASFS